MGYPTRTGARRGPSSAAQVERLQGLLGERGRQDAGLKAVTEGAAASLGQIALRANRVSAAPTAADFNALVEDVHAIAAVLNAMGAKFTGL